MAYPKELIKSVFRNTPEQILDIIASDDTHTSVEEVSSAHNISKEVAGELADEVTLTLIGVTPANELITNLQARLGITADIATSIAQALKDKIFSKIPEKVLITQEAFAQRKLKEGILAQVSAPVALPAEQTDPSASRQELIDSIEHPQPAPERTIEAPKDTAPKLEPTNSKESPSSLAPATATPSAPIPASEIKPDATIVEKVTQIVAPSRNTSYPDGKDPYREPAE